MSSLILTANKRLSADLANRYHDEQVSLGCIAWGSVDVLPFTAWLVRCWDECRVNGVGDNWTLLSVNQAQVIWQRIVGDSEQAAWALQAWRLLWQWDVAPDDSRLRETWASRQFLGWAREFTRLCRAKGWIDPDSLGHKILDYFARGLLTVPQNITLVGFLELTPLQKKLLNLFKQKKCWIKRIDAMGVVDRSTILRQKVALTAQEDEIYAMAQWAQHLIEHEQKTTIGCIIPKLSEMRADVARIFTEVCGKSAFNISVGRKIITEPMIFCAVEILRLLGGERSIEDISYLLRSPFLGGFVEEFAPRAMLEVKLRKIGDMNYDLSSLIAGSQRARCSVWLEQLVKLQTITYPAKQLPSIWVDIFLEQLKAVGWPGERALDSKEYQLLQHWQDLLSEFAQLDLLGEELSYAEAREILNHLCVQTIFQSQTTSRSIQILGELEAVGLTFEHVWLMGLNDCNWPPRTKPNPFLSVSLQRKLAMPHASAERELHFSKLLLEHYFNCAAYVVVSYATKEDDHNLNPSSLISSLKPVSLGQLKLVDFHKPALKMLDYDSLEFVVDDRGPVVSAAEKTKGGTGIFKQQAACPFRAFAQFRLGAKAWEKTDLGLSSFERGSILHKALELLWRKINTRQKLLQLSDVELEQFIKHMVKLAIKIETEKRKLKTGFLLLEEQRVVRLLKEWFAIEKTRSDFEVVACEQRKQIKIGGLTINALIDRVDCVAEKNVLIDYKSGNVHISSWFGERPDEPQLLLYAVSAEHPVSAIAYAQIRADGESFKGVGAEKDLLPGVKAIDGDWAQQLNEWREVLAKLAQDFCNGEAKVDPKDINETCKYCDLAMLCRVEDG
jgi:ATP-dependent helicase/nuclease subunit B